MSRLRSLFELCVSCVVYCSIVILIDFVGILFFTRETAQLVSSLSFVLLIEGALALIVGGGSVLYSPVFGKLEEVMFHFEPWNAARQKKAESHARIWVVCGGFLVLVAILVSMLAMG
jgi:hypothetical protein